MSVQFKLSVPYYTGTALLGLKDSIVKQLVRVQIQALKIEELRDAKKHKRVVVFKRDRC